MRSVVLVIWLDKIISLVVVLYNKFSLLAWSFKGIKINKSLRMIIILLILVLQLILLRLIFYQIYKVFAWILVSFTFTCLFIRLNNIFLGFYNALWCNYFVQQCLGRGFIDIFLQNLLYYVFCFSSELWGITWRYYVTYVWCLWTKNIGLVFLA